MEQMMADLSVHLLESGQDSTTASFFDYQPLAGEETEGYINNSNNNSKEEEEEDIIAIATKSGKRAVLYFNRELTEPLFPSDKTVHKLTLFPPPPSDDDTKDERRRGRSNTTTTTIGKPSSIQRLTHEENKDQGTTTMKIEWRPILDLHPNHLRYFCNCLAFLAIVVPMMIICEIRYQILLHDTIVLISQVNNKTVKPCTLWTLVLAFILFFLHVLVPCGIIIYEGIRWICSTKTITITRPNRGNTPTTTTKDVAAAMSIDNNVSICPDVISPFTTTTITSDEENNHDGPSPFHVTISDNYDPHSISFLVSKLECQVFTENKPRLVFDNSNKNKNKNSPLLPRRFLLRIVGELLSSSIPTEQPSLSSLHNPSKSKGGDSSGKQQQENQPFIFHSRNEQTVLYVSQEITNFLNTCTVNNNGKK